MRDLITLIQNWLRVAGIEFIIKMVILYFRNQSLKRELPVFSFAPNVFFMPYYIVMLHQFSLNNLVYSPIVFKVNQFLF